jgi:hypothetical protein
VLDTGAFQPIHGCTSGRPVFKHAFFNQFINDFFNFPWFVIGKNLGKIVKIKFGLGPGFFGHPIDDSRGGRIFIGKKITHGHSPLN